METLLPLSRLPLFFTFSLALLLTPGPAVLYIMARSMDQGRRAGIVSVLGIHVGTMVHIVAAALGLSAILVSSALAFNVVKYAGAAYLILLGIRKLISREEVEEVAPEPTSLRKAFTQGIVVNILNPKTALFFFAFLPQFVDPARGSVALQFLLLGAMFTAMGACTDSAYALVSGTARGWLRGNRSFLRAQKYVAGSVYIGLGVTAALAGNRK